MSTGKSSVLDEKRKILELHNSWVRVSSPCFREVLHVHTGKLQVDPIPEIAEQDLAHDMTGSRSTRIRLPGDRQRKNKCSIPRRALDFASIQVVSGHGIRTV